MATVGDVYLYNVVVRDRKQKMKFREIILKDKVIAEVLEEGVVIRNSQDVLEVMGECQADGYVFYTHHFEDDFFDLSTKKLGEVMQKFANYRVKMAVVGDFSRYPSKTLKDFIYESNRMGEYLFMGTIEEVIKRWSLI